MQEEANIAGMATEMLAALAHWMLEPFEPVFPAAFGLWSWQSSIALIAGLIAAAFAARGLMDYAAKKVPRVAGRPSQAAQHAITPYGVPAVHSAYAGAAPDSDHRAGEHVSKQPATRGTATLIGAFASYNLAGLLYTAALSYIALSVALFAVRHLGGLA